MLALPLLEEDTLTEKDTPWVVSFFISNPLMILNKTVDYKTFIYLNFSQADATKAVGHVAARIIDSGRLRIRRNVQLRDGRQRAGIRCGLHAPLHIAVIRDIDGQRGRAHQHRQRQGHQHRHHAGPVLAQAPQISGHVNHPEQPLSFSVSCRFRGLPPRGLHERQFLLHLHLGLQRERRSPGEEGERSRLRG